MATREQLQRTSALLRQLAEQAVVCESIAKALIEVDRDWEPGSTILATDYQVARRVVARTAEETRSLLADMKRTTLNADFIRADAAIERVLACCRKCPSINAERVRNGEPFQCQVHGQERPVTLRFNLNGEGLTLDRA